MGKLRTALRVVTDMGLILVGLGICLTGYAIAVAVIAAVGVYLYLLWDDCYQDEGRTR